MFPAGADNYIVITFQELSGYWYHSSCMTQAPLEGTYKYIRIFPQGQPDTLVLIPSLLTIVAMRFSSVRGTFSRRLLSGVSLDIV